MKPYSQVLRGDECDSLFQSEVEISHAIQLYAPKFNKSNAVVSYLQLRDSWVQSPILSVWNFGFRADLFLKVVYSVPQFLYFELEQLLDLLEFVCEDSTARLSNALSRPNHRIQEALQISDSVHSFKPKPENPLLYDEISLFEAETERGLIKVVFEPGSQQRLDLITNERAAQLWGMSKETFLEHLARYDLTVPFCEIDWLASFILDLTLHFEDSSVQYLRMLFSDGETTTPMLVQRTIAKGFNNLGQLREVRPAMTTVHLLLILAPLPHAIRQKESDTRAHIAGAAHIAGRQEKSGRNK